MPDDYNSLNTEQKKAVDKWKEKVEYMISANIQQFNKDHPEIFLSCPFKVEMTVIQPFKLNEEAATMLIGHLNAKGWNAALAMREKEGVKSWEQLRAIRDDGLRFHIDTIFFRGMTNEQMCLLVDEYSDRFRSTVVVEQEQE